MNGASYISEPMEGNNLILRIATSSDEGDRLALPRIPCGPGDDDLPFAGFRRAQFSMRVCFSIIANIPRSQSFSNAPGLDFRHENFTHGQPYAALLRSTNPNNLYNWTKRNNRLTTNVLYTSVPKKYVA